MLAGASRAQLASRAYFDGSFIARLGRRAARPRGLVGEAGRILDAGVALVPVAQWVLLELYFVLSSIALAPYMHKGKRNRGSKL